MSTSWSEFLEAQGAQFNDDQVLAFPQPPLSSQPTLVDLTPMGIIHISGEGSDKLLQGQLTCDINQVSESQAQFGAYCTPKGRMIGNFWIWRADDDFLLFLSRNAIEHFIQTLSKYAVFYKCSISNHSQKWVQLAILGNEANTTLSQTGLPTTNDKLQITTQNQLQIINLPGQQGYLINCPIDQAENYWLTFSKHCSPAGYGYWQHYLVDQGIAWINQQFQEKYIPQQFNMQFIEGISFKKGCYTGQEIVARTQYLGKLKSRLYHIKLPDNATALPGQPLYSPAHNSSVGEIISLNHPTHSTEALAVLMTKAVNNDDVYLDQDLSKKVQLLSLPYTITNEGS
ncbi:folate-binding protein YgfZ [Zooshikella marina]|uniref:CAF17-like 4Fe-4S cluster assembly/insertion protein YgfZ n=1 Tax=Zooshikella ganghwensis TaxID=202772 RepID=UPI001BAFBFB8|nr:folate-binding protein YgfZ [Zooshikella ganghwensis]MBU2705724.1 folate-binding protein YgfZ [Zooshikella ganghwensis]